MQQSWQVELRTGLRTLILSWTEARPHTLTHHLCITCLQGDRVPEKGDCTATGSGGVGASPEGGNGQAPGQGRPRGNLGAGLCEGNSMIAPASTCGPWDVAGWVISSLGWQREQGHVWCPGLTTNPCFPDLRTGRKPANTEEFQFYLTGIIPLPDNNNPLPLSSLPCPQFPILPSFCLGTGAPIPRTFHPTSPSFRDQRAHVTGPLKVARADSGGWKGGLLLAP